MEHAHPSSSSYAQRVFQMSLKTLGQVFEPKFIYDQILHQCEVFSSLWVVGRANKIYDYLLLFTLQIALILCYKFLPNIIFFKNPKFYQT
jgi:hypothetical protein